MTVAAAVDIGTQSTRLLVSDGNRDRVREVHVTHLGAGVDRTGVLDPDRVAATLEVLRRYRSVLDEHGVTRVRAIATAVVRRAGRPEEFLDAAAEALGTRPEMISGEEEGELAFRGATAALDRSRGPFTTVDLGGGSTEFAVGLDRCEAVHSAPFGATSLTERFVLSDPPRAEELSAALSVIEIHLDDVARDVPAVAEASTFVGLGGTFTTLAAVEIGLEPYDRDRVNRFELTRDAAEDVFRNLVVETDAERAANPGLVPARVRTIVGGACAVVGLMRFFGLSSVVVSDDDLLDGMVAGLLA